VFLGSRLIWVPPPPATPFPVRNGSPPLCLSTPCMYSSPTFAGLRGRGRLDPNHTSAQKLLYSIYSTHFTLCILHFLHSFCIVQEQFMFVHVILEINCSFIHFFKFIISCFSTFLRSSLPALHSLLSPNF
jgi:hypothetical protein